MKVAKLHLSAKNRRVSVLLKECSIETTGLAARKDSGDQSPKGVFFMAGCKGALNQGPL